MNYIKKPPTERKCKYCDEIFIGVLHAAYCSTYCKSNYYQPRVDYSERECESCGKLFKPKSYRGKKCSRSCGTNLTYINTCKVCNKQFKTKRKTHSICCNACRSKDKYYNRGGKERNNNYKKRRYKEEPRYRLDRNMGRLIWFELTTQKNGSKWQSLTGYTIDELMIHIEKQFTSGMTWSNYGEWHIDHIIPRSLFNYTRPAHKGFKECWALSNLQPLWAGDNIIKGNKIFA